MIKPKIIQTSKTGRQTNKTYNKTFNIPASKKDIPLREALINLMAYTIHTMVAKTILEEKYP
ncbi:MAG: hypothetical protein PUH03_03545, partial [bacterium]|nr:hypothetical protein [bacterium]